MTPTQYSLRQWGIMGVGGGVEKTSKSEHEIDGEGRKKKKRKKRMRQR